jgi:hypothetical protein
VTQTRHPLVAMLAVAAAGLGLTSNAAEAAGTRAGATRAAKRHVVTYVKRYGMVLRTSDLDLEGSTAGAVALEVLRLRQRRPVHRHPERDVLDTRTDLAGAGHRHRLRRMMSRYRGEPPLTHAASVGRHRASTGAG